MESCISILAPAWGASACSAPARRRGNYFNSRPRVGASKAASNARYLAKLFQFSPPRGGRRRQIQEAGRAGRISILAPAWGASGHMCPRCRISEFQFSPPRGGRQYCALRIQSPYGISILAPAWGASSARPEPSACDCYFNSRPRVGGVPRGAGRGYKLRHISILAPAWGASAQEVHGAESRKHFNSRPRVRGVRDPRAKPANVYISILAPAWGAS